MDWTPQEREETEDWGMEGWSAYRQGREPEAIEAPTAWPIEAVLIAAETLAAVVAERSGHRRVLAQILDAPKVLGMQLLETKLRTRVQRYWARRVGATPETTPQPRWPTGLCLLAAGRLAYATYLRRREGVKDLTPPWSFALAATIIREIDRRRSWTRAGGPSIGLRAGLSPPAGP